jgi:AraC family transcriptional regulator of adaptative response/methylated-DNA-[protein]-cysteine methyltransferase
MKIRYAVGQCVLGWTLVAVTERGLCAVELGDDREALAAQLRERFPQAAITAAESELADWVAMVVASIETPGYEFNLPLDLQGTAFQQRVWQALREIPAGTTLSYAELAQRIGQPQAVRAVAGACATNPVAVIVPCHRVVRIDGELSGYRWGMERKQTLLEREAGG